VYQFSLFCCNYSPFYFCLYVHARSDITEAILANFIKLTRLPSNPRPTTRECVHLVTRVTSGHVTKMAVTPFQLPYPKTPCYMRTPWLCSVEPALWPIEVYITRIGIFDLSSCDLDPMTFIYELYPYSIEIYRMCK